MINHWNKFGIQLNANPKDKDVHMSNTICIGHGMGAHVCGMAGHMETEHSENSAQKTENDVPSMFCRISVRSKSKKNYKKYY